MRSSLALSLIALEASAVVAQRVVSIDFEKRLQPATSTSSLRRRQGTVLETLTNGELLYIANVTVGTPGQALSLQIDTGSSDVWMSSNTASLCTNSQTAANCYGGTFNPSGSTTYTPLSSPVFNISYVDGSGSTGNFFTDVLTIGNVSLTKQQMGLATVTTVGTGIMGVGFSNDESVCHIEPCTTSYPSVIDQLVLQNKIAARAYSLYLNDLQADTGSILFGGIDTTKYSGSLISVPIQPDADTGVIMDFTVPWTSFAIQTSTGTINTLTTSNFVAPAILDSGTSLTYIPTSLAKTILTQVAATYNRQLQGYIAACSLGNHGITLNFQFGGSSGPTIKVPLSEMLLPIETTNGQPAVLKGEQVCQFGILPAGNGPILLGDTFLRSAYVVYDLENTQIALAQTRFNATASPNILEIQSGANGIPSVSSTATGVVASQTGTIPARASTTVDSGFAATAVSSVSGTPILSGATAAASTSHSGASTLSSPVFGFTGPVIAALVAGFVGVGSLMVLL